MIDKFDIFILTSIHETYKKKESVNTWEMSKEYAKQINEKDTNKVYRRLKARLNLYVFRDEIFFIDEDSDGKQTYNLHLNNFGIVKHKFPDGYGKAILIRI